MNHGLRKPLFHRTYLGVLSYPSGHTAKVFALAATLALLLNLPPRPEGASTVRIVVPAAACVLGDLVAVGVIGLRWHYFTDTVADCDGYRNDLRSRACPGSPGYAEHRSCWALSAPARMAMLG